MSPSKWLIQKKPKPVCAGTGFVALDVVVNGDPIANPKVWAGGTCANVLTILSYLGWNTYPIAKLKDDVFATMILKDLKRWRVNTSLISRNNLTQTPIVVHRIRKRKDGLPTHRFEWNCPTCGASLPHYSSLTTDEARKIPNNIPVPQVFFFDRVSKGIFEVVNYYKRLGALIVFEPCGIKDNNLFLKCLEVSDILKYSHKVGKRVQKISDKKGIPLEIETLGSKGVRFRLRKTARSIGHWELTNAYPVKGLKDAAGAGDWCTAGIIHLLGEKRRKYLIDASIEEVKEAINFGQALAALNCQYEGARGGMYPISRARFKNLVEKIWVRNEVLESWAIDTEIVGNKLQKLCPMCPE